MVNRPEAAVALDLVGFGEPLVLLQPPDGQTLAATPALTVHVAGAEFNVCAAVARLGGRAALCSRVGDDPLGTRVLTQAQRLGVDTSLLRRDPDRPTGVFLKDVHPDGQRRVYYYRRGSAASTVDESDARRALAARPAIVLVSGITLALGPSARAAVELLVGQARAGGVAVALDPNLRPALGPVAEQAAAVRALLSCVDYLLLGTDESLELFGTADPAEVFTAATAAGVGETVLKAGPDGCYHRDPDATVRHLPSVARDVVDPVGAGDAFAGGYLFARLRGGPPAGAARLGSHLAAAIVAERGDTEGLPDPRTAADLLHTSLQS